MKIACIASSRIPSETANSIQAMKVCQALAQNGHQVTLIAPGNGPAGKTEDEKWAVLAEHYGLHTRFDFIHIPPFEGRIFRRIFPWRAAWRTRRLDVDMIYTWLPQAAVAGLMLNRITLLEMHDLPPGMFGPYWYGQFLERPGRKRQLVITRALQQALAEEYPPQPPDEDNIIAPNGVDLSQYEDLPKPKAARAELDLPQKPTVACTGHLYAGRGADIFLRLALDLPELHFMWVGGRPRDVERWRKNASTIGIENVSFVGFKPNSVLPLYQAAADLLLMPYGLSMGASSGENPVAFFNPMKMFDYMASSRPIIASDLPVIHEILGDKSAVFLPPGDPEVWGQTIRQLLADRPRMTRLAKSARVKVEPYTWQKRALKAMEGIEE